MSLAFRIVMVLFAAIAGGAYWLASYVGIAKVHMQNIWKVADQHI
jgi:hypothetical protein